MNVLKSALAATATCIFMFQSSAWAQTGFQTVMLIYSGDPDSVCPSDNGGSGIPPRSFRRISAAGDGDTRAFVVPGGKRLIITDVVWNVFPKPRFPLTSGDVAILRLAIFSRAGDLKNTIFNSTPVLIANNHAQVGGVNTLTSGLTIGSGKLLCASIARTGRGFDAGDFDPGVVYVYGRLEEK